MSIKFASFIQYFFVGMFMLFISIYLAAMITGRDERTYFVLSPDDNVVVAGKTYKALALAKRFQPKMYLRMDTPSPDLLWYWYVVIPNKNSYEIIYYQVWENEIHPLKLFHIFYAIFRTAYYGYPLYDIEYFQVSVSKDSGDITGLLFETSPSDDFFVNSSEHVIVRYTKHSDDLYVVVYRDKASGQIIDKVEGVSVEMDNGHPLLLSQTWNHLTRLKSNNDTNVLFLDAPLRFLTEKEYSRYKFVRKSQGDFQTVENRWSLAVASLLSFVMIALPSVFVDSIIFRRKKEKH